MAFQFPFLCIHVMTSVTPHLAQKPKLSIFETAHYAKKEVQFNQTLYNERQLIN
jgi:hypothetical protein